MKLKQLNILLSLFLLALFVRYSSAQTTISSNKTGKQGDYYYEYWKDNGTGTMTLGDGGNFSCTWGSVGNILFRKGIRPGLKNHIVTYSAISYKPNGNSYLAIYGWTRSPLVEYYIVESWGSWKPPGSTSKGTVDSDSGTYDIYQMSRNGANIDGNGPFTQYWSVRKAKKTSGIVTCANHFAAWESKGMKMGSMYEVSLDVEAYQSSGGTADVAMSISTVAGTGIRNSSGDGGFKTIMTHVNSYTSLNIYNPLGQKINESAGRDCSAGQHSVLFNASNLASGVYYYPVKKSVR
jgi:endo-1,4-beta-xylanase